VCLAGGLALPEEPVLLLLELEARGFVICRDGADLMVRPSGRLTEADCQRIRYWKWHLLAVVDYTPPEVQ
jgi:hypothetical protein